MTTFKADDLEFSLKDVIKLVTLVIAVLAQVSYFDKRITKLELGETYYKNEMTLKLSYLDQRITKVESANDKNQTNKQQELPTIKAPDIIFDRAKEISIPEPVEKELNKN